MAPNRPEGSAKPPTHVRVVGTNQLNEPIQLRIDILAVGGILGREELRLPQQRLTTRLTSSSNLLPSFDFDHLAQFMTVMMKYLVHLKGEN